MGKVNKKLAIYYIVYLNLHIVLPSPVQHHLPLR
nr:MAG TPA: hypothetical protein [Caudoviricetes sp.]